MQQFHRLEDVTWAASSNRLCKMTSLPPGKRVRELVLFCDLSGTKDSADAVDGRLFAKYVSSIKLGNYVNIPGWELQELCQQVYGAIYDDPTDVPGSGTTFDAEFTLRIPFRDPRQPASDDGSMPTDMLRDKSLELTFAAANVQGVGNLVVTAGTVRVMAEIVDETDIPQINQIGYADPGSLTYQVEQGVYKDLFVVDGASGGGTITRAEVVSVDFEADGKPVWNNALHEQIVSVFNASGLRDASAALTHNAASRLPLVWHDQTGKANITKQPCVESAGRVQLTGTISAPRYVYWRALPKDAQAVTRIAQAIGAPADATTYQPSTATKTAMMALEKGAKSGQKPKKVRVAESILKGKLRSPGFVRT